MDYKQVIKQNQNDIIDCRGEKYIEIIKREILSFLYNNAILENSIFFLHSKDGLTGEQMANTIISCLELFRWDIQYLRGQGMMGS